MSQTPWLPLFALSLVAGAGAGAAVRFLPAKAPALATELSADRQVEPGTEPWRAELAKLSEEVRSLQLEVQTLAQAPRVALAANAEQAASPQSLTQPAEVLVTERSAAEDAKLVQDWFEQLATGELDGAQIAELWDAAKQAGKADELLAMFEARAQADPQNPDVQTELGNAYLQRLQQVGGNSAKVGMLAMKADKSFDRALALDEGHLDARLSKAVALSFWPPVMGKQAQAVQQFELLIAKQNAVPQSPKHKTAYLLLGNMHMQMGAMDKARATWTQGLERFPGDEELMRQLESTNH